MVLATTTQTIVPILSDAITATLAELATDAAYTNRDADLTRIARQPITAAAVLFDLCTRLGEPPPACIADALSDEPPS